MPSTTEITVTQLSRLIGLPDAPAIVDVRIDEDYARPIRACCPARAAATFSTVADWAARLRGRRPSSSSAREA